MVTNRLRENKLTRNVVVFSEKNNIIVYILFTQNNLKINMSNTYLDLKTEGSVELLFRNHLGLESNCDLDP